MEDARETMDGTWDEVKYHRGPIHPSLRIFHQSKWDDNYIRVDRKPLPSDKDNTEVKEMLQKELIGDSGILDPVRAARTLHKAGLMNGERNFQRLLRDGGWDFIYTFRGSGSGTHESVTDWDNKVGMVSQMKGFVDEFGECKETVLYVKGETRLNRKAVRFPRHYLQLFQLTRSNN
jgi:hypothetical protein